jgi:hypothetical protein
MTIGTEADFRTWSRTKASANRPIWSNTVMSFRHPATNKPGSPNYRNL